MNRESQEFLALRFAAALLLKNGEVNVKDISLLPFVNERLDVHVVTDFLVRFFGGELVTKLVSSKPVPRWEEVVRMKGTARSATLRKTGELLQEEYVRLLKESDGSVKPSKRTKRSE